MTETTGSKLLVVDSCGWLEFLTEGANADAFAVYLKDSEHVLLPVIVVYEVYKKLFQGRGSTLANVFMSHALTFKDHLIPVDLSLSIQASRISAEKQLAMADALVYATAQRHRAELITSDSHFANLPGVTLV